MNAAPSPSTGFRLRDTGRLAHILRVLVRQGFSHYLERLHLRERVPTGAGVPAAGPEIQRFRAALEELGPSFVKFGQVLSVRRDLFAEGVIAELEKLQDKVPPFPAPEARAIVEQELGRPLGELYARFDEQPMAAASVAQVHGAALPDGTEVIVKIQRPGIAEIIRADIEILYFLARLLARYVPESRRYDPLGLVAEFADTIERELDFVGEGRNADRFRADFRDEPAVYVPRVFWELSGRRVLTMEHSTGRRMHAAYPPQPGERRRVAETLVRLLLVQLFEHGFFHGDLHPGNVFLLADGRLCFHDFGIVGRLDARAQEQLRRLVLALIARDAGWMAEVYVDMGVAAQNVDRAAFARDVGEALAQYYAVAGREYSFAEILRQFIRLGSRYEIRVPREFLLVAKVFMQIESLARTLDPGFSMLAALHDYAPRLVGRELLPVLDREAALAHGYRLVSALRAAARDFPEALAQALQRLERGEARLSLRHEPLESLERRLDRAANRLSFGLIVGSLVIGASIVTALDVGPRYAGVPVLGLIGYALAALLGLAWAAAVRRSGRF